MIRAMTDQSLTGVGCYPLTLLQEAEQSERAVAFYRDGVIAVSLGLIPSDLIWSGLICIAFAACHHSPVIEICCFAYKAYQENRRKI